MTARVHSRTARSANTKPVGRSVAEFPATETLGKTAADAEPVISVLEEDAPRRPAPPTGRGHLRPIETPPIKVLLVEDNDGDAFLISEMLEGGYSSRFELTHLRRLTEAKTRLATDEFDVMLLDLGLPDAQGLDSVQQVHALAPDIPLVVLTGLDDERIASLALQEGAQDYLVKGQIDVPGLRRAVRHAIERKTIEEKLFAEQESARVTLNSIADAVISTDLANKVTYLNSIAEKMTGWSRQEAIGRPLSEVFRVADTPDAALSVSTEYSASGEQPENRAQRSVLVRRDGFEAPIEDSTAPIRDSRGRIAGSVTVFHDVSERRAMEQRLSHLAQHDSLTDLPNRRLFDDRLSQAISLAHRRGNQLALLFSDIDRFKHINDSLGHAMGDKLLQSVAERLKECVRASDTVSRQGGDEFIILLPEIRDAHDAAVVAKKVLSALALPHHVGKHDLHISASMGISTYPNDAQDAETLIKHADVAMYQAKEKGRNNYQFFKPEMNVSAMRRQSLEASLRLGLERQEFVLQYQPKIDLETGQISGAEALVRWKSPDLGVVPPNEFIGVAEECGLILPIGRWVLHEACRQAQAWIKAGLKPVPVAVNVSALEFRRKDFLEGVRSVLRETGLDPRYLELELTETVLMKDAEPTIAVLHALKDAGVKLAIDDFGTGYSSLSYLTRLPIDNLKIDRSFVTDVTTDTNNATIVSAVIGMGKSLDLNVIAEGIETQEQLALLRSHNCAEGQGFYFSRPVPATDFVALLGNGASNRSQLS